MCIRDRPDPTRNFAAPAATAAAISTAIEHEIQPRWSTQRTARLTQSALLQTRRPLQVLTGHLRMLLHQKSRNKNQSPTQMPQTSVPSPLRIQTPTSTFWKDETGPTPSTASQPNVAPASPPIRPPRKTKKRDIDSSSASTKLKCNSTAPS